MSSQPLRSDPPRQAKPSANGGKPLDNPRHERFAQELAKGASQIGAYETAGYSADRSAACKLSAKAYISQRVAELQGLAAARIVQTAAVIDKSYVLQQANRMYLASASAAIPEGADGQFDPKAANVAARFLEQVGNHTDVGAFTRQQDISLHITVDQAISRLATADTAPAIEADYTIVEDVTED